MATGTSGGDTMLTVIFIILSLIVIMASLYVIFGIITAMGHVSRQGEYDTFDFFGVMISWPKFLWCRIMDRPWN